MAGHRVVDPEAERLLEAVAGVADAVDELRSALDHVTATLHRAANELDAGLHAAELSALLLSEEAVVVRHRADASIGDYQHAMQRMRGLVIRALIDTDGLTIAAVSRALLLSPQMVRRLYRLSAD